MNPTVRPVASHELDRVLAVWREAEAMPGATDSSAALAVLLETSAESLLVAELDGELVGTLTAAWDGWRGNLYRLAVLPGHRRRGVARALIAEGERRLRERGAVRVSALVLEDSEAPELWAAAGYERDDRVVRFVKML